MNVNTNWSVQKIGDDTVRYEQSHTYNGNVVVEFKLEGDTVSITRGADHAHQSIIDHAQRILKGA